MDEQFSRTECLLGSAAIETLSRARVAVFGIGGVGGYAAEALARTGVGKLDLIDNDEVVPSNLNRQIIALHSTLGQKKVDVARARILDINPRAEVRVFPVFVLPENIGGFDFSEYDYVVDAIDTVSAKMALVLACRDAGVPILSSMGTGCKSDPTLLRVSDIYDTEVCPLARVMRSLCRKSGVKKLKVVWSPEERAEVSRPEGSGGKNPPASVIFTPAVAGLILASEVVKDLISVKK